MTGERDQLLSEDELLGEDDEDWGEGKGFETSPVAGCRPESTGAGCT